MVKITSKLLLLLAFCCMQITALAQSKYKVKAQKVNVRSQPSTKSAVVGSLSEGTVVEVKGINNGWATITYKGKTCYVSSSLLEKRGQQNTETRTAKQATQNRSKTTSEFRNQSLSSKNRRYSRPTRKALWRFDISAMPQSGRGDYNSVINLSAMLGGDFPLVLAGKDFTLETGLRYLNRQGCVEMYNNVLANANFLEVPVRLAYDLPVANNLSLRLGAGPYLSYMMDEGGGLGLGLEPTVALKWKNFSVGLQYSAALSKGFDGEATNVAMLNLCIRFGGKGWNGIAKGLSVVGGIAQNISDSGILTQRSEEQEEYQRYLQETEKEDVQLSPEAQAKINKLRNELKRLRREINRLFDQQESLQRQKLYGDKYERNQKRIAEIRKRYKEIGIESTNIWREARGKKYDDSNDKKKIEEEYEKDIKKAEKDSKSNYKYLGMGDKYRKWYFDARLEIDRILDNKNYSVSEKRSEIKRQQSIMKEWRKKYREYMKEDIPNADDSYENWVPTNEELLNGKKK